MGVNIVSIRGFFYKKILELYTEQNVLFKTQSRTTRARHKNKRFGNTSVALEHATPGFALIEENTGPVEDPYQTPPVQYYMHLLFKLGS